MTIKIRKESFGYIFFRQSDRKYFIVEKNFADSDLFPVVKQYFPEVCDSKEIVIVQNKDSKRSLNLSAPIGLYLEISQKCNLNCGHCYKPDEVGHKEMGLDQIKNLLRELTAMGVFEIRLCGNEPTASKWFFEVTKYIKERGLYLGINTNGFFGKRIKEYLGSLNPDLVVVSVDGKKETHSQIRGRGVYEKAIELLKYLRDLNINCRINTVLSKKTLKIFPQ